MARYKRKRSFKKPIDTRYASMIVIATEGSTTEKEYFDMIKHIWRNSKIDVRVIPSTEGKSSPKYILDNLDRFKNTQEYDKEMDEFWLMVDVDRWEQKELDEVTSSAISKGVSLALSNPCFECWLFLHFDDIAKDTLSCKQITKMLKSVSYGYHKPHIDTEKYQHKVSDAISRAKAMDASPQNRWPVKVGTHVYKVVEKCTNKI